MKNKCTKQSGITIIALVVTVVILLILASVSLNLVLSKQGLVDKAKGAKNNYADAEIADQQNIDDLDMQLGEFVKLPRTDYTKPYLPTGFTTVGIADLDAGVVIRDKSGNEYVWVEVPKNIFTTATSATDYAKITADLKTYTADYKSTTYSDVYYSDATTGLTSAQYTDLYQKMLKSLYTNGGFWVGRYEAGTGTNRTTHTAITEPMVTKPNQFPYNNLTCSEAETLAKAVAPSGYNSSLMFGVQWDLLLKYIEEKEVQKGALRTDVQSAIQTNSSTWGNYNSIGFDVKNENAQYSNNNGDNWNNAGTYTKPASTVLLTTGATTRNSKQNIYDIAGNMWEWTLEYTGYIETPSSRRGSSCYSDNSAYSASTRLNTETTGSYDYIGFRVALY